MDKKTFLIITACIYFSMAAAHTARVIFGAEMIFFGISLPYIFSSVSKQAWMEWLQQQTMLVNEKQLDLSKKESRDYLSQQLENFLNNESFDKAEGFVPLDK